jgi:hypothetical protein
MRWRWALVDLRGVTRTLEVTGAVRLALNL